MARRLGTADTVTCIRAGAMFEFDAAPTACRDPMTSRERDDCWDITVEDEQCGEDLGYRNIDGARCTVIRTSAGKHFAGLAHATFDKARRGRAEKPLFGPPPVGARRCLAAGDMLRFRSDEAHCVARGPLALPRGLHATCWEGGMYKEQCGEELGFIAPNGLPLTVVRSPQGVFASHRPKAERPLFGAARRRRRSR